MNKYPITTGAELIRALQKVGYAYVSQNGSHVKLKNERKNRTIIVPIHGKRSLPLGTFKDILKNADIDIEEIREYL